MVLDIAYLKKILMAFQTTENAHINIRESHHLQSCGLDPNTKEFVFHMCLLADKSIIENDAGRNDIAGIGYEPLSDGTIVWGRRRLRLTALGHDLATAWKNDIIWKRINNEFKDQSITVLLEITKSLVTELVGQRLRLLKEK